MVKKLKGKDRIDLINAINDRLKEAGGGGGGGTTYTAGEGIEISEDDVISATPYTAGDNVVIDDYTVSAKDTTYTAGDNITIDEENVISAKDTTYTAGDNITIDEENVISAKDTTYTAGDNITIEDGKISSTATGKVYTAGPGIDITNDKISANFISGEGISVITSGSYKKVGLSVVARDGVKYSSGIFSGAYTAGDNVTISNAKISAKDTTYTAGTGIDISSDYVISATGDDSGNFASYTGTVSGSTTQDGTTTTDNIKGFGIITPYLAFIQVLDTNNVSRTIESAVIKLPYSSATPIELPDTWETAQVTPIENCRYTWEVSIDETYNEIRLEANDGAVFIGKGTHYGLTFIIPINPKD